MIAGGEQEAAGRDRRNGPAVLNVERSVRGRRWRARSTTSGRRWRSSRNTAFPKYSARVLAARGVAPSEVAGFLSPKLRDLLPDPSHLLDMDRAVERVVAAIVDGERIGVFADYDVDGAASAALIVKFLRRSAATLRSMFRTAFARATARMRRRC